jgi:hypothetical protein
MIMSLCACGDYLAATRACFGLTVTHPRYGMAHSRRFPNPSVVIFIVERGTNRVIADSQKSANVVSDAQGVPNIVTVNQTALTTIKVFATFLINLGWPEKQVMVWQNSYVQVRHVDIAICWHFVRLM